MVKTKWHRGQGCKKNDKNGIMHLAIIRQVEIIVQMKLTFELVIATLGLLAIQKEFLKHLLQNSNPFLTLCHF